MSRRVLVLSGGTGASNNLVRSLKTDDPSLLVAAANSDRFILKKSPADRHYLTPPPEHPEFVAALRRLITAEDIHLLIPSSDADVRLASGLREEIRCRVFLPSERLIEVCQDKFELTSFLRSRGVPAPLTYPVTDLAAVDDVFRRFGPRPQLWCRIRTGSGSRGAIPVKTPEQARHWIAYWHEMRGVPVTAFTLSEYLPGRDFAAQSIWNDGSLVLFKMCERLDYFGGGSQPSGVSSTPALAKTVFEPSVVDVCRAAVQALDERASGVFGIDLKEDENGVPCITEINAGRFFMITSIFDLTGKYSMAGTYVRVALGNSVDIADPCDVAEDYYLVRDLDTLPGIYHADELSQDVIEMSSVTTH